MIKQKLREACRHVVDELTDLSTEEFHARLDRHKKGCIAITLRELGYTFARNTDPKESPDEP